MDAAQTSPASQSWRPALPDLADWRLSPPPERPSATRHIVPAIVIGAEAALVIAPLVLPLAAPAVGARVLVAARYIGVGLALIQMAELRSER